MDMITACRIAAGETRIRLHRIALAEACLMDYRMPGEPITASETRRLMELVDAGESPADAAEQVQAETGA